MNKFSCYYPVRPFRVNQAWGIPRPEVYAQFGFTRHNGIDLFSYDGQTMHNPVAATVVVVGYQPAGAGNFVTLRTNEPYTFNDNVTAYVEVTMMHMQRVDVSAGQRVSVGEVLGLCGKTGFVTGPHIHMRCRRVRPEGSRFVQIDTNDAQNSFDQAPYWNGQYADTQIPAFHYQFLKNLKYGMEDPDVRALQRVLQLEGILVLPQLTDFYGDKTLAAVQKFQKVHNIVSFGPSWLTGYGICGPNTRALLNKLYK